MSVWGYFHTETEEDFLAAGRSIGPWVGGAVLAATQISAGTYVGTLGRHYLTGVSWTWIWFGVWTGMGDLGDLRRAQASAVRRVDGRRLRREALRQRGRAHAGGGADHRHLHDSPHRAVPGDRRDCVGHLRHRPARGDDGAAGEHRLLHGARRRSLELVHRVRADADHGAARSSSPCQWSCRTSAA